MGLLDDAMDTADALLGDEEAAGKTVADPPATFVQDGWLDGQANTPQTAAAPQLENALDQARIDVIHFGRIFADDGLRFPHAECDDRLGEADLDETAIGRASQVRAALQRETLLVHEFMNATQIALTDYENSKGPMGAAMDMATDLITGDEETAAPPTAAELDLHKEEVSQSGGYANLEETKWIDLHTTGRDLHLFLEDYRAFGTKCETAFIKRDGASGGKGLAGLLPEIPGVPGVINDIQSYVFKAFDIYLGMFFACRATYEPEIVKQVSTFSVARLRAKARPLFDIWFPQPPVQNPTNPNNPPPGTPSNPLDEAVQSVKDEVQKVEDKVDSVKEDVRDFLGFEDQGPSCPGDATLNAIFASMEENPSQAGAPTVAGRFLEAFTEILGVEPPDFIQTVIKELSSANLELVKRVYRAIMMGRASLPVDRAAMMRAGRETLSDKIVEIASRLIPGLDFINKDQNLLNASGVGQFGGEEIGNIASRYLDQGLGDQLAKVAEFSSGELAPVLEEARTMAGQDGRTMEPLLGRLPYVLSLQFRNTFFPLIDLVLEAVFGAIKGPASQALGAVTGIVQDAKMAAQGVYNDAMDAKNEVEQKKKDAEKIIDNLSGNHDLMEVAADPEAYAKKMMDTSDPTAPSGPGDTPAPPPDPFPGSDRVPITKGLAITAADIDESLAQQGEMTIKTAE